MNPRIPSMIGHMIIPPISLLPKTMRERIFYRFLNTRQHWFRQKFIKSRLSYAPGDFMHDLFVGDVISGSIALTGFYGMNLSRTLCSLSKNGGICVDVGANLGYYSLLWLNGHPENEVIAIETAPRNQKAILKNIEANNFESRFELMGFAAGNENRHVTFNTGSVVQSGWGGISVAHNLPDSFEVEMKRLDTILPRRAIALLKIDVEGADTWVIQGCEDLLRNKMIDRIFFEQHPERMKLLGISPGEAQKFLMAFGYQCRQVGRRDWEAVAVCASI